MDCYRCKISPKKYSNGMCQSCNTEYMKEYRKTDAYKKHYKKDYEKTKEKRLEYKKEYFQKTKQDRLAYMKEYTRKNPQVKAQYAIITAINKNLKKQTKTIEHLGCEWDVFYKHIENQFLPEMNWGNHGNVWEIDHIQPLSKGGSFHYTNTQPLFKTTKIAESFGYTGYIGNRNKSNK